MRQRSRPTGFDGSPALAISPNGPVSVESVNSSGSASATRRGIGKRPGSAEERVMSGSRAAMAIRLPNGLSFVALP